MTYDCIDFSSGAVRKCLLGLLRRCISLPLERDHICFVFVFFFFRVSVTGDDDKFLLVRVDTANSAIVHNAMGKQKHTHTLISRFVDCMEYTLRDDAS